MGILLSEVERIEQHWFSRTYNSLILYYRVAADDFSVTSVREHRIRKEYGVTVLIYSILLEVTQIYQEFEGISPLTP